MRCIKLYYFERTEQFFIFFRDNDRTFRFVIVDKDYQVIYNKNSTNYIKFPNSWNNVNIESIIYLKNEEKYALLSDFYTNDENKYTKIFSINITANITNNYSEFDNKIYFIEEKKKKKKKTMKKKIMKKERKKKRKRVKKKMKRKKTMKQKIMKKKRKKKKRMKREIKRKKKRDMNRNKIGRRKI